MGFSSDSPWCPQKMKLQCAHKMMKHQIEQDKDSRTRIWIKNQSLFHDVAVLTETAGPVIAAIYAHITGS